MSLLPRTKKAVEVLAEERWRSIRLLSREEAWRIYRDLCAGWEKNPNKQGVERLEQRRITHLLELRRKLDRIGGKGRDGYPA